MAVQPLLVLPTDRLGSMIFRAVLDFLFLEIDPEFPAPPTNRVHPAGRQDHGSARPEVDRVDDQVANDPGFIIDDKISNVAESMINRFDTVPTNGLGRAKVAVALVRARFRWSWL